eukprot:CAMPEP_0115130492 /NCGR_PEP_ID=MMETSP0227-20121206/52503_1 /TAXON_ID=89957 /ORGANISM="Polarella glacialis, Strain CCMP 1383" /LENGTH=36 /DNA_ID= /DNA_START= /DNA_END= /DNA_ORIENTATION=
MTKDKLPDSMLLENYAGRQARGAQHIMIGHAVHNVC